TSDNELLKQTVQSAALVDGTALYQGLMTGIDLIKSETGRRAIIVYTDGGNNRAPFSPGAVIDSARANNLPIYTISLGTNTEDDSLKKIADQTSGLFFKAATVEQMKEIYGKLSVMMQNYYVMAHASPDPNFNRTWRSVDVKTNLPGVSGRAVGRYQVPGPPPQFFTDLSVNLESKTDTTIIVEGDSIHAVTPGELFDYIIRYENSGSDRAQNVSLTHFLPDSVSYISASVSPQTIADDSLVWLLPGIMPTVGDSIIVTVQLLNEIPLSLTEIISDAIIYAPDDTSPENNIDSDTIRVLFPDVRTDLSLALTSTTARKVIVDGDLMNAAMPGETFQYQINITNLGMNQADTVKIVHELPAPVSYISSNLDTLEKIGSSLVWEFLNWQPSETKTILVNVQLAESIPPDLNIIISHANLSSSNDTTLANNSDAETIKVIFEEPPPVENYDLSIKQSVSRDTTIMVGDKSFPAVWAGNSYQDTLIIANLGPDVVAEFEVWDVIPDSVILGNFSVPLSEQTPDTLFWRFDSLVAGDTIKISFDARVATELPFSPFPLINEAGLIARDDTSPQNNQDTTIVYVIKKSPISSLATDLALEMSSVTDSMIIIDQDTSNVVFPGENYQYSISIDNKGLYQADSVKLVHTLPNSVSFISATVTPKSLSNDSLIWEFDFIEPLIKVDISIFVKLSDQAPRSLIQLFSRAEIVAKNDSTSDNNIAEDIVLVRFQEAPPTKRNFNLAVQQDVTPDTTIIIAGESKAAAFRGATYSCKIKVDNFGPVAAKDFSIWELPPNSVLIVGYSAAPTKLNNDTLFWQINLLDVGESLTIDLDAKVADTLPFTPFPLLNRVGLIAEQDTMPDDNFSDSLAYAIARPDDPRIANVDISVLQNAETDSSAIVNNDTLNYAKAGEIYSYTITILNESQFAAEDVVVTDFIPDSVSTSNYQPAPITVSSDSIRWHLGYMLPQTKAVLKFDVTVRSKMPVGKNILTNHVKAVSSNEDPARLANNTSSEDVINLVKPAGGWQPLIEATPPKVKVGSNIKVRVQVTVPVESWDLFVYLADGQVDRNYGDPFIAATDLVPNQWLEIDPQYVATRMYSPDKDEPLIFELRVLDVFGELKTAQATVEIENEDDFIMERNLFVPDQENE
ncbi:MAG TPA: VWA domain-containing protein, partial [bacterium]